MTDTDHGRERCEGCGAIVPRIAGPVHRYMTAAPGCWAMHGELAARILDDPAAPRFRQFCVDAYAVQHPGSSNPQAIQSVACHLMNLYAVLERQRPIELAPAFLQRATRRKDRYQWLVPPSFEGVRTIGYVLGETNRLEEAAREWAADAWRAWQPHRAQVETWYAAVAGA